MDCDDIAVLDDAKDAGQLRPDIASFHASSPTMPPSPMTKPRSLSDGGNSTPGRNRLSPSPLLLGVSTRPTCKDDSSIGNSSNDTGPVTPRRAVPSFQSRGMAFQLPVDSMQLSQPQLQQQQQQQQQPPPDEIKDQEQPVPSTPVSANTGAYLLHQQLQQQQQHLYHNQPTYMTKPTPLSPKLDPSQIYASPTNILPRRSRGLDFSRAATSLHHSTLAEQSSPDSSPIASGSGSGRGAMNIPGRKPGDYGGATESSTSLWSMMGQSQEKVYPSSSLGSVNIAACSDSSSSSDEDDDMDEDTDEPFITTPQVGKTSSAYVNGSQTSMPWMPPSSPAMNSLLSFTHRQRPRKQPRRKVRGPLGLGFSSITTSSASATASAGSGANASVGACGNNVSKSPPSGFLLGRDNQSLQQPHTRRESISWAANQLHISGSESDDNLKVHMDAGETLGPQRGVVRRAVTRRGNLLPKTKGFARIRAALAEENAPAEADFRREAEVVRLLESDMEPAEHRLPPPPPLRSTTTTANSSPSLFDNLDDLADDVMAMDALTGLGLSAGFGKQPADKSIGVGRPLWNKMGQLSAGSLISGQAATTPPPTQLRSYSTSSMPDDASMDSPITSGASASGGNLVFPTGGMFPMTTTSSSGGDTPQPGQMTSSLGGGGASQQLQQQPQQQQQQPQQQQQLQQPILPSAAEITRRINSKRRRDDDLDLVSFKRRAVSPGMSVHNSPIMQSPLQRDVLPWGGPSMGTSSTASRPGSGGGPGGGVGSIGLFEVGGSNNSNNNGNSNINNSNGAGRIGPNKSRVGYQAMVDTNDSITRLSIE